MNAVLKKVCSIVLLGSLGFSIAACGNGSGGGSTAPSAGGDASTAAAGAFAGQTLQIGVWGGNDAEEKALDQLSKNFETETGAKVEKKVYTDYNTQIQTDLIGKSAPDVFYVDSSMYPFLSSTGALSPLDKEQFETDKFYDRLLDSFTTEGELYAVPKDFSTLALYMNTGIFEEVGVSVDEVPDTFEGFEAWLPTFQAKLDEKYGAGAVHAMSYNGELARNMHIAQRGDLSVTADEGYAQLEEPGIVDNLSILSTLKNASKDGFVTPKEIGTGWNGEAFGLGKIAIMDEGNWVYQTLVDKYSDITFEVKEMPTYKDTKGSMMFVVGWAKYAGSKNAELADAWISYVTGQDGMGLWCDATGTLPARGDVAETLKVTEDPVLSVHLNAWEYATDWQKGITITTIDDAYKNYITEGVNGTITIEEAMKKADSDANADIKASLS